MKAFTLRCAKGCQETKIMTLDTHHSDNSVELMRKAAPYLEQGYLCHILDNNTGEIRHLDLKANVTTCKDCGRATTPGAGSARCPDCWNDRCGT